MRKNIPGLVYRDEPALRLWHPGDSLVKTAHFGNDELRACLANIKPERGVSYVLVNAMGAYESFGANSNYDAFEEHELLPSYKTFETAKVFTDHCFPAGTLVVKADRSRVPIESIKKGDSVVTATGVGRVSALMSRHYSGPGVELDIECEPDALRMTADHKVLVYRRGQINCRHKYSRITKAEGHSKHCLELKNPIGEPTWAAANTISAGDYVLSPRPKPGSRVIPAALARLIGWVAADGCLSGNRIEFTFSPKSTVKLVAVIGCLEELGTTVKRYDNRKDGLLQLAVTSAELAIQLSEFVAGKDTEKHLTAAIMELDQEAMLRVIAAHIDGDGSVSKCTDEKAPSIGEQLRIRSCSPKMLRALQDIARAVGARAVTVGDFVPLKRRPAQVINGMDLFRVLSATQIDLDEIVYDFEVAGSHNFLANEIIVHNCNTPTSPSRGTVHRAIWNAKMKRVELVLCLPHALNEEILTGLEQNKPFGLSMGCSVRYDRCSICSNEAPTKFQYCHHILRELGHLYPDGRQVVMFNVQPKFFDISVVERPADRTGWAIEKVASLRTNPIELVTARPLDFSAGIDMDKTASSKSAASDKIADIDKQIPDGTIMGHGELPDLFARFYKEQLPILRSMEAHDEGLAVATGQHDDLITALATLARHGVFLKPAEFHKAMITHLDLDGEGDLDLLPRASMDLRFAKALGARMDAKSYHRPALLARVLDGHKRASYEPPPFTGLPEVYSHYIKQAMAAALDTLDQGFEYYPGYGLAKTALDRGRTTMLGLTGLIFGAHPTKVAAECRSVEGLAMRTKLAGEMLSSGGALSPLMTDLLILRATGVLS